MDWLPLYFLNINYYKTKEAFQDLGTLYKIQNLEFLHEFLWMDVSRYNLYVGDCKKNLSFLGVLSVSMEMFFLLNFCVLSSF